MKTASQLESAPSHGWFFEHLPVRRTEPCDNLMASERELTPIIPPIPLWLATGHPVTPVDRDLNIVVKITCPYPERIPWVMNGLILPGIVNNNVMSCFLAFWYLGFCLCFRFCFCFCFCFHLPSYWHTPSFNPIPFCLFSNEYLLCITRKWYPNIQ